MIPFLKEWEFFTWTKKKELFFMEKLIIGKPYCSILKLTITEKSALSCLKSCLSSYIISLIWIVQNDSNEISTKQQSHNKA
jgi:hypothetical protein